MMPREQEKKGKGEMRRKEEEEEEEEQQDEEQEEEAKKKRKTGRVTFRRSGGRASGIRCNSERHHQR